MGLLRLHEHTFFHQYLVISALNRSQELRCLFQCIIVHKRFPCRIHVRRTDKKSEARYHDLEEYMNQVSKYLRHAAGPHAIITTIIIMAGALCRPEYNTCMIQYIFECCTTFRYVTTRFNFICRLMNGTSGTRWNTVIKRLNEESLLPQMNHQFSRKLRPRTRISVACVV